jgi:NADH-quinone oxidoreductase subunit N
LTLLALLTMLVGGSVLLLFANALQKRPLVAAALALGSSLLALMFFAAAFGQEATLLGMIRTGGLTSVGGITLSLVAALVALGALANPGKYRAGVGEFYAFILYTALGGVLMVGANNLLLLYLGLELVSYSTYVLVGYYRDDRYSTEAASKYFTLGAVASAFLLYGISLLFSAGGGLYYDEIAAAPAHALLYPGLALLLVGFGFKLALVPFHAWTPDAYQGAPTMVAALVSVGPKAGAVIALGNLLLTAFSAEEVSLIWQQALVVLAVLTMTVGNLQALGQTNIKRLLGYSSVAQLGFVTVGLATGTLQGFQAVTFYALGYAFSNIGAFTAVAVLRDAGVGDELDHYAGLGRRQPVVALLFTLFLLSLAGVPLLVGFAGKLFVFQSAVDAGLIALAVIALLNTVLAFFYYFRLIVAIWLSPAAAPASPLAVSAVAVTALAVSALLVVALGILPAPALGLIAQALEAAPLGLMVGR